MIDQYEFRVLGTCHAGNFLGLASADEVTRIGALATTRDRCNRLRAGGARKASEFVEVLGPDGIAKPKSHEDSALTGARAFEHATFRIDASIGGGFGGSAFFDRQAYSSRRHDGRNRMLVN